MFIYNSSIISEQSMLLCVSFLLVANGETFKVFKKNRRTWDGIQLIEYLPDRD